MKRCFFTLFRGRLFWMTKYKSLGSSYRVCKYIGTTYASGVTFFSFLFFFYEVLFWGSITLQKISDCVCR